MSWTKEQIGTIPEVYRDFMLSLKPVIDTRQSVLRFEAVHIGSVYDALLARHEYTPQQCRQVADNLKEAGLVREDDHGFLTPTEKGETLIRALSANGETHPSEVPPLPALPW
jgi:hypothetical protein